MSSAAGPERLSAVCRLPWQACERCGGHEAPADFLEQTLNFNRWLREHLEHVDTSAHDPGETATRVATWVRSHL